MDPTASSRNAVSTSSIVARIAGNDGNGSDAVMSPIGSPVPNASQFAAQHARRRSYVTEQTDAWARQANGKTNGDGQRFRQNSGDRELGRGQLPIVDTGFGHNGHSNGNGAGRGSSSADGFIMSPRLEQGGYESKLGRISDATEDNGSPSDDDEATGLTEADRKRRQQLRARPKPSDMDDPGGPGPVLDLNKLADASVMRKSMGNVGLIGLWYFFSLSISIYNKWMFGKDHLGFEFPLFTTSTHMLVQFSLASLVLYIFPRFRPNGENVGDSSPSSSSTGFRGLFDLVSRWFYVSRLGPCGAATGLDIGLGNMSLKFISLTFFTMCKSSALAFVLLFAFIFKLETPSLKLVLIIALMTAGVVMMVFGEVNFDLLGFVLIILSSFFSGFRWAVTQILLLRHPATSNPFASIFFLAPIMFVSLLVLAVPIETVGALGQGLAELIGKKGIILGPLLLLFPGMLAFCMTSAEYALLQRTSVVTLSICGIFKEVVTISAAELVYHDPLTPINLSGLFVTICSIGAYNYLKVQKMRREARERAGTGLGIDSPGRESPRGRSGLGRGYDEDSEERRGMLADAVEMNGDEDMREDER